MVSRMLQVLYVLDVACVAMAVSDLDSDGALECGFD